MESLREHIRAVAQLAGEAAAETLWPTRCIVCDMPGSVLCERCARNLSYLDWWRACHRCGSPYGYVQCSSCNEIALEGIGRESLPFASCASAVRFDDAAGRIVRGFKDQGEQRLAPEIASFMARVLPPEWRADALTFVPATLSAYRYRGFDHVELIARELSRMCGIACLPLLARPHTRDQRGLSPSQRVDNVAHAFRVAKGISAPLPRRLLLVDDVYTTGATLCSASDALRAQGVCEVRCLTFARV